jgi:hypothetical protein
MHQKNKRKRVQAMKHVPRFSRLPLPFELCLENADRVESRSLATNGYRLSQLWNGETSSAALVTWWSTISGQSITLAVIITIFKIKMRERRRKPLKFSSTLGETNQHNDGSVAKVFGKTMNVWRNGKSSRL